MIHVTEELIRRGYTDAQIEKIWGGNFIRVWKSILEARNK
jgi:membrane dipeptidase